MNNIQQNDLVLYNPNSGLTKTETEMRACTSSSCSYSNDNFWKMLENLFNLREHEILGKIELKEDHISAWFVRKGTSGK